MSENLKLVTLDDSENLIKNKLDFLLVELLKTEDIYISELLNLCIIYLSEFDEPQLDEVQICIEQARFHFINYCLRNGFDIDA